MSESELDLEWVRNLIWVWTK